MAATEETLATIRAVFDAIKTRDRDRFEALMAPDAIMSNPATGESVEGSRAIANQIWAVASAFPDLDPQIVTLFADGEQGVAETLRTGTHTAPLRLPNHTFPPTGRKLRMPECILFRVREEKVLTMSVHTDRLATMEQLGMMFGPTGR